MKSLKKRANSAVALAVLMLVPVLAACQPPNNFYEDPAAMPAANGGVARQTVVGFNGKMDLDQHVVLYRTTGANGEPILVSGSVVVPDTPWTGPGERPVVAYATGTQGTGDGCAPSKTIANGGNYEILIFEALLEAGYALAITDYQGLGTPGEHAYMVTAPAAHALLDVARVAVNLPEAGLSSNAPVFLNGYSQGAQGVARAAEIESVYAPELNVAGAAAGATPADIASLSEFLNEEGRLFFGLLLMALMGHDAAYPELNLDFYLTPDGRAAIEDTRDQCFIINVLQGLGGTIEDYTWFNPLYTSEWQARVDEQRVGRGTPTVPVYLYHTEFDEILPVQLGRRLRDDWCDKGAPVQWQEYAGIEHIAGIYFTAPDVLSWMNDRVNGVPFQANCG